MHHSLIETLNVLTFIFLFTCCPCSSDAQGDGNELPAAKNVIRDYIAAIGGEMPLHGIESMTWTAELDGLDNQGDGTVLFVYNNGAWCYHFELAEGVVTYQRRPDGTFWQNIYGNIEPMSETTETKIVELIPFPSVAIRWLDFDGEIEFKGYRKVRKQPCCQLEFRLENGRSIQRFFDVESKLLIKTSYRTEFQGPDWFVSDYQEFDGIMIPLKQEQHFSGNIWNRVKTKSILLNEDTDDKYFTPLDSWAENDSVDDQKCHHTSLIRKRIDSSALTRSCQSEPDLAHQTLVEDSTD